MFFPQNVAWLMKVLFSMIFGFLFMTISTCWNPWLIPDENQRSESKLGYHLANC
jgi:hypothetical protein